MINIREPAMRCCLCVLIIPIIAASGCREVPRDGLPDVSNNAAATGDAVMELPPLFVSPGYETVEAKIVRLEAGGTIESTDTSVTMERHYTIEFTAVANRASYQLCLNSLECVVAQDYLVQGTPWLLIVPSSPGGSVNDAGDSVVAAMPFRMLGETDAIGTSTAKRLVQVFRERLGSQQPASQPTRPLTVTRDETGSADRAAVHVRPLLVAGMTFRGLSVRISPRNGQSSRDLTPNAASGEYGPPVVLRPPAGAPEYVFVVDASSSKEQVAYFHPGTEWFLIFRPKATVAPDGSVVAGIPRQMVGRVAGLRMKND